MLIDEFDKIKDLLYTVDWSKRDVFEEELMEPVLAMTQACINQLL